MGVTKKASDERDEALSTLKNLINARVRILVLEETCEKAAELLEEALIEANRTDPVGVLSDTLHTGGLMARVRAAYKLLHDGGEPRRLWLEWVALAEPNDES